MSVQRINAMRLTDKDRRRLIEQQYATLQKDGTIPDEQVTGQITDIIPYDSTDPDKQRPAVGDPGKYYRDEATDTTYRWDAGTGTYVETVLPTGGAGAGKGYVKIVDGILYAVIDHVEHPIVSIEQLAARFSKDTSYVEGNLVSYQGKLYEFTSDHAANPTAASDDAAWVASDVAERTVADLLDQLRLMTVRVQTQDGLIVTGQRVLVYAGTTPPSASDSPAFIAEYDGHPVEFVVPRGFEYYVMMDPERNLYGHFSPTTATGTMTDATSITLTYQDSKHVTTDSPAWIKPFLDSITADTVKTDEQKKTDAKAALLGKRIADSIVDSDNGTTYSNPLVVTDVDWYKGLDEAETPEFSATAAYTVGAKVRYGNRVYRCTSAHTAGSWDASHFKEALTVTGTSFLGALLQRKWTTRFDLAFDATETITACDSGEEATAQTGVGYYGWGPTWSSEATYAKDAFVYYSGTIYKALAAVGPSETTPDADSTNWAAQANNNVVKAGLVLITPYNNWDEDLAYPKDYQVQYGGKVYKCSSAVTTPGTDPATDTTHWTEQTQPANRFIDGDALPYSGYLGIYKHAYKDSSKNIIQYGHNNWKHSGVRQYLNSDSSTKGTWWQSQHLGDAAIGSSHRGYMAGCSEALLSVVKPVWIKSWPNSISDGPGDASTIYETLDTFFLPSGSEMYGDVNRVSGTSVEGNLSDYWKGRTGFTSPKNDANNMRKMFRMTSNPDGDNMAVDATRPTYADSSGVSARLRSAYRGNSVHTWLVSTSGTITSNTGAYYAYGLAPACVIG